MSGTNLPKSGSYLTDYIKQCERLFDYLHGIEANGIYTNS